MRVPVPRNRLVALTLVGALLTSVVAVGLASPGLLLSAENTASVQPSGSTGQTTASGGSAAAAPSSGPTSVERDGEIHLAAKGDLRPGGTVSIVATRDGAPVAGALVEVDGEEVGRTGENGRIKVPVRGDELEVEVESDDARGRLEVEWDR